MNRSPEPGLPPPSIRERLLELVPPFVLSASRVRGVRRISLLGSITTEKSNPKDVDLLVRIGDDADLDALAKLGRQLRGGANQLAKSADVFLCDEAYHYLGRTCKWRKCRPGIRVACEALHCGRRQYLYDDLGVVRLNPALVAAPPVDLFPAVVRRQALPADVERMVERLPGSHNGSAGVGE